MNPTQQATAAPVDDAPRVESIGEIVVFVDGYTDPTDIMEFAGVLAQEYDAHLTGVFMRPAPAVTPPEMFVRGTGIPNVIEARQAEVERIEADHRALFDDIVRRNALGSEWRSVPYFSSDAGVHVSPDLGQTWFDFSQGLPRISVVDLVYQVQDRTLTAATYGRSLWRVRPI